MILCIGEAVIDMFHKTLSEPVDNLNEVFFPFPGGCSYNTSIAIGRLGAQVAFIGRISKNFFGNLQVQRLRENNVRSDLLLRCEQNPVLAFIKTEKGKQPEYAFYDEGTADRLLSIDELQACYKTADPSCVKCISFGSISMAMEPIATSIETLVLKEAAANKVIAFDPNIRPFIIKDRDAYMKRFKRLAGVCTIAKISSEDFEYIFPGIEPEEALRKTLELGTRLAIVTLGSDGAIALLRRDNGNITRVQAPALLVKNFTDTVGAGDTFQGAFLVWLEQRGKLSHDGIAGLSEEELYNALLFASKASGIVCTKNGVEPPTLAEIESYSQ
ncbi:MAG: carbohydrate kinase [Treponema sp.]|nr:carbohydrate kinase [Treponema sp.]